jgi:hypothetical protein
VTAFAVDRWVIGTADDVAVASADSQPRATRRTTPRPGPSAAPVQASAANASFGAVTSLTQRLEAVARAHRLDLDKVSDAFVPPPAWIGTRRVAVAEERGIDSARDFLARHRLTAVMKQQGGGVAIIEGKTVAVGQSIGGFRLVVVKDKSAVLRRGDQRVELRLPEDATASTSEKPLGLD